MNPDTLWAVASDREREALAAVYSRLRALGCDWNHAVSNALALEILEHYDYRSWPEKYQLSNFGLICQQYVSLFSEAKQIDRVQRANYLQLSSGGRQRHLDVAYGLSDPMLWSDKQLVITSLIQMGRRTYTNRIPTSHDLDNGVLHAALSYKHMSTYDQGGTISPAQAEAIWHAVKNMEFVNASTRVRVWVDQNLHRAQFPPGTEWHEFGLLPYACLQTVFVGTGDCSLKHAYSRPWLWVEMVTALKAYGLYTKPGTELVDECGSFLLVTEPYKTRLREEGAILGTAGTVDTVFNCITRLISLWRRDFLAHANYEFMTEFERFVNWARRFVIRGVPYSQMAWNHSSLDVVGMDAIVLVRELVKSTLWAGEASLAFVRQRISWKRARRNRVEQTWFLDDLIDRTMVGNLPLNTLIETREETSSDGEAIVMMGKANVVEGLKLERRNHEVILSITGGYQQVKEITRYGTFFAHMMSDHIRSDKSVTLEAPATGAGFVTYRSFTHRFCVASGMAGAIVGDAMLRPRALPASVEEKLGLERLGFFYDVGICEEVYAVHRGDKSWPLCTTEIIVLLIACGEDLNSFGTITETLKEHCSYKEMWYKDLNDDALLEMTRRWKVERVEKLDNPMILSGERDTDVSSELVEKLRKNNAGCTFVWTTGIGLVMPDKVQITFGGRQYITRLIADRVGAGNGLAILKETDRGKLVNSTSTGLIQMVAGIEPERGARRYNSTIHPMLRADENGPEIDLQIVSGLFATCNVCQSVVCPINGLVAEVSLKSDKYHIEWQGKHSCTGQVYHQYDVIDGLGIL